MPLGQTVFVQEKVASIIWDKTYEDERKYNTERPQSLVAVKIIFGPFCSVSRNSIDGPEPAV